MTYTQAAVERAMKARATRRPRDRCLIDREASVPTDGAAASTSERVWLDPRCSSAQQKREFGHQAEPPASRPRAASTRL